MPRAPSRAASSKAMPAKKAAAAPPAGSNYPVIKDKAVIADVEAYLKASSDEKAAKAEAKRLKGCIEGAMEGAPTAFIGTHIVSISTVDALPGTANVTITRDMIGQVIPGSKPRAGYTQLRVQ